MKQHLQLVEPEEEIVSQAQASVIVFKIAVAKTLGGNTYDIAIRRVNTTGSPPVTLRIKNVNSEFSQDYVDAVVVNPMPVVLSGGLWSDLLRWEREFRRPSGQVDKGLAKQLIEEGRDTWLIEMTGGPLIERSGDPNYNYSTLVDEHWTASMAAVQYYTDKITTQYVGNSNGCRVALSALEKYQETGKNDSAKVIDLDTGNFVTVDLQASPTTPVVDTFIGTGCPGAFDGSSPIANLMRIGGDTAINNLEQAGNYHPTLFEVFSSLLIGNPGGGGDPEGRISLNLLKDYHEFITNETDEQPGDIGVDDALIIYGEYLLFAGNDFVVPDEDADAIYNKINSSNKEKRKAWMANHFVIPDDPSVKSWIMDKLEEGLV